MSAKYEILRFGVFELNVASEELRKSGTIIHLPPQPFHLLAFLASRAGQVVTREEIEERLWSDEADIDFERRINQCIKQIRIVLGDDASQPVYIETLRLHGYRFLVPVVMKHAAAPPPKITVSDSSGLVRDLAARVMARIAATTTAAAGQTTGPLPAATTATVLAAQPGAADSGASRKFWPFVLLGAAVLLAVIVLILYWYSHRTASQTSRISWHRPASTVQLANFVPPLRG